MARLVKLMDKGRLGRGHGTMVETEGRRIAVFNVEGEFYAVDNTCPHRGGPLGEGELEGVVITCPWHGRKYDVITGSSPNYPELSIHTYSTEMQGDEVFVELE